MAKVSYYLGLCTRPGRIPETPNFKTFAAAKRAANKLLAGTRRKVCIIKMTRSGRQVTSGRCYKSKGSRRPVCKRGHPRKKAR